MAEIIETLLAEASGAGVQITLKDASGVSVVVGAISAISYTWSKEDGEVVNSRLNVAVTPANPVTVKFTVLDTTIASTELDNPARRLLTVTWTYTDSVLGLTNKVKEYLFSIDNSKNK